MRTTGLLGAALAALAVLGTGCSTSPTSSQERQQLVDSANAALTEFKQADPGLDEFLAKAHGYAVFPSVGKGGFWVGGAYGRGIVYEKGSVVGYCDLTQATFGLQFGGQSYSELIAFENRNALDVFRSGNFAFSANASAVAIKAGAAAAAKYDNGVAVFVRMGGGLMVEASIGGQKFSYTAK